MNTKIKTPPNCYPLVKLTQVSAAAENDGSASQNTGKRQAAGHHNHLITTWEDVNCLYLELNYAPHYDIRVLQFESLHAVITIELATCLPPTSNELKVVINGRNIAFRYRSTKAAQGDPIQQLTLSEMTFQIAFQQETDVELFLNRLEQYIRAHPDANIPVKRLMKSGRMEISKNNVVFQELQGATSQAEGASQLKRPSTSQHNTQGTPKEVRDPRETQEQQSQVCSQGQSQNQSQSKSQTSHPTIKKPNMVALQKPAGTSQISRAPPIPPTTRPSSTITTTERPIHVPLTQYKNSQIQAGNSVTGRGGKATGNTFKMPLPPRMTPPTMQRKKANVAVSISKKAIPSKANRGQGHTATYARDEDTRAPSRAGTSTSKEAERQILPSATPIESSAKGTGTVASSPPAELPFLYHAIPRIQAKSQDIVFPRLPPIPLPSEPAPISTTSIHGSDVPGVLGDLSFLTNMRASLKQMQEALQKKPIELESSVSQSKDDTMQIDAAAATPLSIAHRPQETNKDAFSSVYNPLQPLQQHSQQSIDTPSPAIVVRISSTANDISLSASSQAEQQRTQTMYNEPALQSAAEKQHFQSLSGLSESNNNNLNTNTADNNQAMPFMIDITLFDAIQKIEDKLSDQQKLDIARGIVLDPGFYEKCQELQGMHEIRMLFTG